MTPPHTDKNPAAVALGKLGGSAKSERKAAASRINGAKGGRPKRPLAPTHRGTHRGTGKRRQ